MTNRLVIFDLDGILIESKTLHYEALNAALGSIGTHYIINHDEHLSTYDGLNTTRKLDMLTERKSLPKGDHNKIWELKQKATFELIKRFPRDERAIKVFSDLKLRGWRVAVCSNSIRETVKLALLAIGVMEYTDVFVSNEDVIRTKPYPEMYWKAMTLLNALPKNTIIIEDSHIGRQGALDSGAHLLAVENTYSWNYDTIFKEVEKMENNIETKSIPWIDKDLNILIPCAGAGSRFADKGYIFPKPLIEVHGKPMIEMVVRNLNIQGNYIFLVQKEHYEKYNMKYLLNLIVPNCKIVLVDGVTDGACRTTLLAREYINNNNPLLICNSDQFLEWDANQCMYAFKNDNIDGGILTFNATHPKWSYARLDDNGYVSEVIEKKVISNHATCGLYYFKHGSDYIKYADKMIEDNFRVNGEFYVAPTIDFAVKDGKKFKIKTVDAMWGTGTPNDLEYFLANYKGKI